MTIDQDTGNGSATPLGSAAYSIASEVETYRRANRRLVELADVGPGGLVLDVGCGPGVVLELLLELTGARAAWGIDPDPVMVTEARRRVGDAVGVVPGGVEDAAALFPAGSMDVVFVANCIHLFDDPVAALRQIYPLLAPGGRLAVNTGFFDGAMPPEDRPLYLSLLLQVRRLAAKRAPRGGGRPRRGHAARRELTQSFLTDALDAAGFTVTAVERHTVVLPREFLMSLVSTPMFAQSVLPALEPEVACEVLRDAMETLIAPFAADLAAQEGSGVRRRWLYVIAERKVDQDHA